MSFHLGVWNSHAPISDAEAASRYSALVDGESASGFNAQVYAFHSRLTDLYPDIETLPDEERDASPWASAIEMTGDHVDLAIQPDKVAQVLPIVLRLADQHGLVCFDPQAGKVHLPYELQPRKSAKA